MNASITGTAGNVTGTVAVSTGGTGLTSVADGVLLFGSPGGTAALTPLATTTGAGRFLTLDFTTGRPSWVATSTLNIALSDTKGTLTVLRGGTGVTSFTSNALLYSNADGTALAYIATSSLNIGGTAATVTTNANMSGAVTSSGSNVTAFGSQSAGVLATAITGVPAFTATSTLYGTGTGGQVLGWNNTTGVLHSSRPQRTPSLPLHSKPPARLTASPSMAHATSSSPPPRSLATPTRGRTHKA